jgi:hypothetical protein
VLWKFQRPRSLGWGAELTIGASLHSPWSSKFTPTRNALRALPIQEPLLSIPRLFLGNISRSWLMDYLLPISVSKTGQGSHFVWNMDNLWIIRFPRLPSLYPVWGGDVGSLAGRALSWLSRGWKDLRFTLMLSYGNSYVHDVGLHRSRRSQNWPG